MEQGKVSTKDIFILSNPYCLYKKMIFATISFTGDDEILVFFSLQNSTCLSKAFSQNFLLQQSHVLQVSSGLLGFFFLGAVLGVGGAFSISLSFFQTLLAASNIFFGLLLTFSQTCNKERIIPCQGLYTFRCIPFHIMKNKDFKYKE